MNYGYTVIDPEKRKVRKPFQGLVKPKNSQDILPEVKKESYHQPLRICAGKVSEIFDPKHVGV
jgi:hypothetical protein